MGCGMGCGESPAQLAWSRHVAEFIQDRMYWIILQAVLIDTPITDCVVRVVLCEDEQWAMPQPASDYIREEVAGTDANDKHTRYVIVRNCKEKLVTTMCYNGDNESMLLKTMHVPPSMPNYWRHKQVSPSPRPRAPRALSRGARRTHAPMAQAEVKRRHSRILAFYREAAVDGELGMPTSETQVALLDLLRLEGELPDLDDPRIRAASMKDQFDQLSGMLDGAAAMSKSQKKRMRRKKKRAEGTSAEPPPPPHSATSEPAPTVRISVRKREDGEGAPWIPPEQMRREHHARDAADAPVAPTRTAADGGDAIVATYLY